MPGPPLDVEYIVSIFAKERERERHAERARECVCMCVRYATTTTPPGPRIGMRRNMGLMIYLFHLSSLQLWLVHFEPRQTQYRIAAKAGLNGSETVAVKHSADETCCMRLGTQFDGHNGFPNGFNSIAIVWLAYLIAIVHHNYCRIEWIFTIFEAHSRPLISDTFYFSYSIDEGIYTIFICMKFVVRLNCV